MLLFSSSCWWDHNVGYRVIRSSSSSSRRSFFRLLHRLLLFAVDFDIPGGYTLQYEQRKTDRSTQQTQLEKDINLEKREFSRWKFLKTKFMAASDAFKAGVDLEKCKRLAEEAHRALKEAVFEKEVAAHAQQLKEHKVR